jgi:5-methylthioadenosine/S-adenosylhomocysteine deaminase
MDPARRLIENGAVAIRGNVIVAVGPAAELSRSFQTKRRIDRPNAILTPGLINAHCHAPMVLLRGIADDLSLQDWLEKYIFPAEAKHVTPDFVRVGTRLAVWEMLRGGVTTYADMYYFEEVIAEETRRLGMRGVLGQTIIRFPVPDAKTPEDGLNRAEAFLAKYKADPWITPAVAPHAPYTNSDAILQACRRLADQYSAPLIIHVSETKRENDESLAQFGLSPVARLDKLGIFNGPTLTAHTVWLSDSDLRILKDRRAGLAHNPSSNMKLASGVAPVGKMLALDLSVGLGTDGPAGSNNDLNLFEEMDLAAKLQKVTDGDPRSVTALQAFEMATIRGARALGLEKKIGSLEPGKRADLITVELDGPHAMPMFDVYSHLVYALKASDVRDSMIEGRWVMRDGAAAGVNRPELVREVERIRNEIARGVKK